MHLPFLKVRDKFGGHQANHHGGERRHAHRGEMDRPPVPVYARRGRGGPGVHRDGYPRRRDDGPAHRLRRRLPHHGAAGAPAWHRRRLPDAQPAGAGYRRAPRPRQHAAGHEPRLPRHARRHAAGERLLPARAGHARRRSRARHPRQHAEQERALRGSLKRRQRGAARSAGARSLPRADLDLPGQDGLRGLADRRALPSGYPRDDSGGGRAAQKAAGDRRPRRRGHLLQAARDGAVDGQRRGAAPRAGGDSHHPHAGGRSARDLRASGRLRPGGLHRRVGAGGAHPRAHHRRARGRRARGDQGALRRARLQPAQLLRRLSRHADRAPAQAAGRGVCAEKPKEGGWPLREERL